MKFLLITLWLCSLQFTPFSFSHAPCTRSICFIYNYSQGTVQRSKERISRKISWILKLFLFTFFFGALQSQCIYYEHSCTYLIPPVYEDKNLFKNTLFLNVRTTLNNCIAIWMQQTRFILELVTAEQLSYAWYSIFWGLVCESLALTAKYPPLNNWIWNVNDLKTIQLYSEFPFETYKNDQEGEPVRYIVLQLSSKCKSFSTVFQFQHIFVFRFLHKKKSGSLFLMSTNTLCHGRLDNAKDINTRQKREYFLVTKKSYLISVM